MTRIQNAEGAECPEDMDAPTPAVRQAAVNLFEAMSERVVQYPEPTPDATLDGLITKLSEATVEDVRCHDRGVPRGMSQRGMIDARTAIRAYVAKRRADLEAALHGYRKSWQDSRQREREKDAEIARLREALEHLYANTTELPMQLMARAALASPPPATETTEGA